MSAAAKDSMEKWFIFQNNQLLLHKMKDYLKLPSIEILKQFDKFFIRQYLLGSFNGSNCYTAEMDKDISLPEEIVLTPLRKAFETLDISWYVVIGKAFSIINWDKNHQFCGRCSHKTIHKPGTFESICSFCELSLYPRISPSIIVLIRKNNKILLSRSPHFPPGIYGLIAGFVEPGESIEDAVHREVKEEISIEIQNLCYFGSQYWPFPDSLMIGFTADYLSGDIQIDKNEIESANWYSPDNLPGLPSSSVSIAKKLIDAFLLEQRKKFKS